MFFTVISYSLLSIMSLSKSSYSSARFVFTTVAARTLFQHKPSLGSFVRLSWISTKPSSTYYALFPKTFPGGPPPAGPFLVSAANLEQEYQSLQALNRLNKLGLNAATKAERDAAENKASQLGAAYRTLLSPLRRSQHLISCRKGVVDPLSRDAGTLMTEAREREAEQTEAQTISSTGVIDEDFLMDVLLAREEAEEAVLKSEIEGLIEDNNQRIKETEESLDHAFKADDVTKATNLTRQLSYWTGIDRNLRKAFESCQ